MNVEALLGLNTATLKVYDKALAGYRKHMLDSIPILLALFNGAGGSMTLYLPGEAPRAAPPVPVTYQCLKAVAHVPVGIYEAFSMNSQPGIQARESLDLLESVCERAGREIEQLTVACDAEAMHSVLSLSREFLADTHEEAQLDPTRLQAYTRACGPYIARCIESAAGIQVTHWMEVLDLWQAELGESWQRLRAVANTLFVTRRSHILYTVLAQYMGEDAMGDRLLLFETSEFTTTPDTMLDLLARVEGDRQLGQTFFADAHIMKDVEILANAARRAIQRQAQARNKKPLLPLMAPFNSHAWPWPTDPASGTGPSTLDETLAQIEDTPKTDNR